MEIIKIPDINNLKLESYSYIDIESKLCATRVKNTADETIQREIGICNQIIEYSLYLKDAFSTISYKTATETGKTLRTHREIT